MSNKPQFIHDCDKCKFLGRWKGKPHKESKSEIEFDLYVHVKPSYRNLDSWIARYGSNGHEYLSSHPNEAFSQPRFAPLWEMEIKNRLKNE